MTINDWRARYLALEQRHEEAVELLRELREARLRDEELRHEEAVELLRELREARLRDEELRLSLEVVEWLAKEKRNESI